MVELIQNNEFIDFYSLGFEKKLDLIQCLVDIISCTSELKNNIRDQCKPDASIQWNKLPIRNSPFLVDSNGIDFEHFLLSSRESI